MALFIGAGSLLQAACAATALLCAPNTPPAQAGRCCMTDPAGWYRDPPEKIEKRFALYKALGVDTLRIELDWRSLEPAEGRWDSAWIAPYLDLARSHGFRIKLIVGALMGPPRWFLDAHPDARITDEDGRTSANTVSYWYPGLHRLIEDKTVRIARIARSYGLLDAIDAVIPALGPAGEPLYPVPWTLGPDVARQTYWCYDVHAQADFRARMRARYRTIAAANATWSTRFATWSDVRVLPPGERPGAYWEDVLTWYRDTKRAYVTWQIMSLRRAFPGKAILLYVPGTAYSEADWQDAVRTARGNDAIQMMADSFWILDTAARTNCQVQYTGCENAAEVARLRAYLDAKGTANLPMWGENAGTPGAANDPAHLADVVLRYRLVGLDYTHAHFVFEPDGVTPNRVFPLLKEAYARIRAARSPQ